MSDTYIGCYVNIDNICLQTELKYAKAQVSLELIKDRFKYGMFLMGIAMLREFATAEDKNGARDDQTAAEKVKEFSRAVSPVLLPMISSLSPRR